MSPLIVGTSLSHRLHLAFVAHNFLNVFQTMYQAAHQNVGRVGCVVDAIPTLGHNAFLIDGLHKPISEYILGLLVHVVDVIHLLNLTAGMVIYLCQCPKHRQQLP